MATNAERPAIVGVFGDRADAERAVDELQRSGFRDEQIGFARRDDRKHEPEGGTAMPRGKEAEAGEGMTTGALTGSVVGGLLGAAVAGLIPGIGPVLAGGILASALGGAAVGAAAGGLLGVLTNLGVPEEEGRYYEQEFQAGRTIVTVKADDRHQEAEAILRRFGAYDSASRGAAQPNSSSESERRV